MIDNIGKDFVD